MIWSGLVVLYHRSHPKYRLYRFSDNWYNSETQKLKGLRPEPKAKKYWGQSWFEYYPNADWIELKYPWVDIFGDQYKHRSLLYRVIRSLHTFILLGLITLLSFLSQYLNTLAILIEKAEYISPNYLFGIVAAVAGVIGTILIAYLKRQHKNMLKTQKNNRDKLRYWMYPYNMTTSDFAYIGNKKINPPPIALLDIKSFESMGNDSNVDNINNINDIDNICNTSEKALISKKL
jgi:hypothetical protein